jgi:hypothetical protein
MPELKARKLFKKEKGSEGGRNASEEAPESAVGRAARANKGRHDERKTERTRDEMRPTPRARGKRPGL